MSIDPAAPPPPPSGQLVLALDGPWSAAIPQSVDVGALVQGLADDHVDAPADVTPALAAVVARERGDGHDLSVVVLDESFRSLTASRDIATAIRSDTGGTVLVFGPRTIGTSSDEFSRVQLEQAQENLPVTDPTRATTMLMNRMTDEPQTPWTVVTLVLIALTIVGAVGARVLQRRRRSRDAGPRTGPDDRDIGTGPAADESRAAKGASTRGADDARG